MGGITERDRGPHPLLGYVSLFGLMASPLLIAVWFLVCMLVMG